MSAKLNVTKSLPGDVQEETSDEGERFVRPRYDVKRNEDGVLIRVDVPGATEDSVQLAAQEGKLTIRADRRDSVGEEWRPKLTGIDRTSYRLQLELGADLDTDEIQISVDQGVLTLKVPPSGGGAG